MTKTFQKCAAHMVLVIPLAAFLYTPPKAFGTAILGSAEGFAVLAGSIVTNTGPTLINGDIGVWPGSTYASGGTITQEGTAYLGTMEAQEAESDVTVAYQALASMTPDTILSGTDLGGLLLQPGIYSFASSAQLTGTLTLDARGDPNALFVFQIGSTLTTSANSAINVIDGGVGTSVFWQVGSSATLGTNSIFAGNILAFESISMNAGATILCGRALTQDAAVTLDTNAISDSCAGGGDFGSGRSDFGSLGFAGKTIQASPEPGTALLLCAGLLAAALYRARWMCRK